MIKLTLRERQVARLAAQGCTDQVIASTLGIRQRRVHSYLQRICYKLRLRDVRELQQQAEQLLKSEALRGNS